MQTPSKPYFRVFPDLKVSNEMHSMFESANIRNITLKKRENML